MQDTRYSCFAASMTMMKKTDYSDNKEEYRMQDTGCTIHDTGYRIHDAGYMIHDTGCMIHDAGCRIHDAGNSKELEKTRQELISESTELMNIFGAILQKSQ